MIDDKYQTYGGNHLGMYTSQIIMLHTLNVYSVTITQKNWKEENMVVLTNFPHGIFRE